MEKKPRRDWDLVPRVYRDSPLIPMDVVRRIQASIVPEPTTHVIQTTGLQENDELVAEWATKGNVVYGCQVTALRRLESGQWKTLLWSRFGFLRDPAGRYLYTPFLTTEKMVAEYLALIVGACGFTPVSVEQSHKTRLRVRLKEYEKNVRRLIPGDHLSFGWDNGLFQVTRQRGTLDMNLYQPEGREGIVMSACVKYLVLPYHSTAVARSLVEANALLLEPLGNHEFRAIARK